MSTDWVKKNPTLVMLALVPALYFGGIFIENTTPRKTDFQAEVIKNEAVTKKDVDQLKKDMTELKMDVREIAKKTENYPTYEELEKERKIMLTQMGALITESNNDLLKQLLTEKNKSK